MILVFIYFKDLKINILQLFVIYAPIFLLYPIAEIEALGRKEMILFLSFIGAIFLCDKKYSTKLINTYCFLVLPLVCLIYEEVVLFFPFFAAIVIIKNNLNKPLKIIYANKKKKKF